MSNNYMPTMPGSANQNNYMSNEQGFNRISAKKPRWDANIKWYDVPSDNNWHRIRFIGPLHMVATHWFETKTKKKFPMFCVNYDSRTSNFDMSRGCPACALDPKNSPDPRIKAISARQQGYIHVIDRSNGQFAPMRMPISAIIGVKKQGKLNTHNVNGVNYEMDVTDPKYGQDINILYDQTADPASRYTISLAGPSPLTEIEMGYFNKMIDWDKVIDMPPKSEVERALRENNYLTTATGSTGDLGVLPQIPQVPSAHVPAPATQMPPMGTYGTPVQHSIPVPPAPVMAAPVAVPVVPAPAAAPVPTAPWNPGPAVGFQAAGSHEEPAPTVHAPTAPVMASVMSTPVMPVAAPAAVNAVAAPVGRSFNIVGRPGPVSAEEFQSAIAVFAQPIAKAVPLKVWDKDDVAGLSVPKCMGAYTGDAHCMKCPVRRYCLTY